MLAVSRAMGDTQFKAFNGSPGLVTAIPEIRSENITPATEFAVIASDGLWDVMLPQAVVNFIRKKVASKGNFVDMAKYLADEAIAQGSIDNVTVIIIVFNLVYPDSDDELDD